MLVLILVAQTAAPPAKPQAPATATVRIERSIEVRSKTWIEAPSRQRREIRKADEFGRPVVLRLIEFQ